MQVSWNADTMSEAMKKTAHLGSDPYNSHGDIMNTYVVMRTLDEQDRMLEETQEL